MNSNNEISRESISAYLDGHMTPAEEEHFLRCVSANPELAAELRLLSAVRSTLRASADGVRKPVPRELESRIKNSIARLQQHEQSNRQQNLLATILSIIRQPRFALPFGITLAVASVVVVLLTQTSLEPVSHSTSVGVDVYNTSYSNFSKIIDGSLEPAVVTSNIEELKQFFRREGVEYQVFFPKIRAQLVGGMVSKHNGLSFAHLVYKSGPSYVYIFEVDDQSVETNIAWFPSEVVLDMKNSRWHWEERPNVGTMFVWKSNSIVCSAVSDMATQDFSALFELDKL